ncbi:RING-H2 finger protein ATL30-like [Lucilia sericata]|uniref:RING-H2 finger protein ATL30-like n=1 Tax=Lucilia sericata TaxID=13632 RepID=UPI0018A7F182|nr:RING-H2 finger protein ATL30-like [Lucilia sericata]
MAVRHSGDNLPSIGNLGDCSVCCSSLNNASDIVRTVCQHYFHKTCLTEWITTSPTCPQCRQSCREDSLINVRSELDIDLSQQQNSRGAVPSYTKTTEPEWPREEFPALRSEPRVQNSESLPANDRRSETIPTSVHRTQSFHPSYPAPNNFQRISTTSSIVHNSGR